jgi:hypothetical protein
MDWDLPITYSQKTYTLKAVVEYESSQIMRIRVQGKKSSILLECNYPLLKAGNSKKGINWKIKEGRLDAGTTQNAVLLMTIMRLLEDRIKQEFDKRDRNLFSFD